MNFHDPFLFALGQKDLDKYLARCQSYQGMWMWKQELGVAPFSVMVKTEKPKPWTKYPSPDLRECVRLGWRLK